MSVLLETSLGDIVIDLYVDERPNTTKNFLKLCKIKYYNHCLFHNVQRNHLIQTGDPTGTNQFKTYFFLKKKKHSYCPGTGKGGESVFGLLYGDQAKYFDNEMEPQLKHQRRGMVSMAPAGENKNASQVLRLNELFVYNINCCSFSSHVRTS